MSCCFDIEDATSPDDRLTNGLRRGTLSLAQVKNLIEVQGADPTEVKDIPKNNVLHHAARLSVDIIDYLAQFEIDIVTEFILHFMTHTLAK